MVSRLGAPLQMQIVLIDLIAHRIEFLRKSIQFSRLYRNRTIKYYKRSFSYSIEAFRIPFSLLPSLCVVLCDLLAFAWPVR